MDNVKIVKVSLENIEQLQVIGRLTFFETFADCNTADNMRTYLDESFHQDKLACELQNPNSEFYFAVLESKIIGYLKLNFGQAQTELKNLNSLEIERIYVLKEFHGKRIGQLLYDKAIEIAHSKKSENIWLGVWEKNERAINFYLKNRFIEFGKHEFILGSDTQTDIMMNLKIE